MKNVIWGTWHESMWRASNERDPAHSSFFFYHFKTLWSHLFHAPLFLKPRKSMFLHLSLNQLTQYKYSNCSSCALFLLLHSQPQGALQPTSRLTVWESYRTADTEQQRTLKHKKKFHDLTKTFFLLILFRRVQVTERILLFMFLVIGDTSSQRKRTHAGTEKMSKLQT